MDFMNRFDSHLISEALRFGIVGVGATVLHYLIYYLLMERVPTTLAYSVGYIISFLANYVATCYFTFHEPPSWKRFVGMLGAHATNFALHVLLLNLFLWIGVPPVFAPAPVYAIVVPINFLLVRFIFKRTK